MSYVSIAQNIIGRITVIVLAICVFADLGLGSPLFYKVTRTIESVDYVELGTTDAGRFSKIRIGVNIVSSKQATDGEERAQVELNAAKRELSRNLGQLDEGIISRSAVDQSLNRVEDAQRAFDGPLDIAESQLQIVGVVDNEEVVLLTVSERLASRSFVIDSPPATIRLKAKGKGKFTVYIWAH